MRTFFYALFISLVSVSITFAQDNIRFKDPDADKFVGTWKYESKDYSITISFFKGTQIGVEVLFGIYSIQKDGHSYEDHEGTGIIGGTIPNGNPNEIFFFFNSQNAYYRQGEFLLTLQRRHSDKAVLRRVSEQNRRGLPQGNRQENPILPPEDIILTKQTASK